MTVELLSELRFALGALLFGVFSGLYYDLFRFLRVLLLREAPRGRARRALSAIFLFTLDFLCVLSLGALFILLLYELHDGVLRFYALPPLLLGFFLYAKTAGRIVRFLLTRLARGIKRLLFLLFHPLFAIISNIFCPFARQIAKKTLSFITKCVKIKGKKNKMSPKGQNQRKNKEPYGKTKRI